MYDIGDILVSIGVALVAIAAILGFSFMVVKFTEAVKSPDVIVLERYVEDGKPVVVSYEDGAIRTHVFHTEEGVKKYLEVVE